MIESPNSIYDKAIKKAVTAVVEQHLDLVVRTAINAYIQALPKEDRMHDALELHNAHIFMDVRGHKVYLDNKLTYFTPKQYDMLRYLLSNKGRALTYKQILHDVWGPAYGTGECIQYVRVVVHELRERIEKDPANPMLIVNEPGIGYRMEVVKASKSAEVA